MSLKIETYYTLLWPTYLRLPKFSLSERRASKVVGIHRSTKSYLPRPKDDSVVLAKTHEIIVKKPRYGMPMVDLMLRRDGFKINHKKTVRIYREAGLQRKTSPPKSKLSGLTSLEYGRDPVCKITGWILLTGEPRNGGGGGLTCL